MPWVERYRPLNFNDIKGQDQAVAKIKLFIENYERGRKKGILLSGGPGVGKTTIAQVIANITNSEIFELNASNLRNKKSMDEILRPALEQQSLIKKGKIILIDEVDGIMGSDRGGVPELIRLLGKSKFPIIFTANDAWTKKLSPLRRKVDIVELKPLNKITIINVMKEILKKENLILNENLIKSIADRVNGDLRAAINDLQAVSRLKDPTEIDLSQRNTKIDIFHALKKVLQDIPTNEILSIYDGVDLNIDDIILWSEENLPLEYSGKTLHRGLDLLSKADVFRGRIYRKQYWRFMVYENIFLSYGISSAKKEKISKYTTYKKPSRILKIWLNNQRTAKKKSISKKYSKLVHIGTKRAMSEFLTIKQIIKSSPEIQKELKLTGEEIEYVNR